MRRRRFREMSSSKGVKYGVQEEEVRSGLISIMKVFGEAEWQVEPIRLEGT